MPWLRCPECFSSTSYKKTEIMNAVCDHCGRNLYDHYYLDKTDDESKMFIIQENKRLKSESLVIERVVPVERYKDAVLGNLKENLKSVKYFIVVPLFLFALLMYDTKYNQSNGFEALIEFTESISEKLSFDYVTSIFSESIDYVTSIDDISIVLIILLGICFLLGGGVVKTFQRQPIVATLFIIFLFPLYLIWAFCEIFTSPINNE